MKEIEEMYDNFNEETVRNFSKEIVKRYKDSGKKELIIINIGTDKSIGDSLGPTIGTMLKNNNIISSAIYGTLENPIHALNINHHLEEIYLKHSDAFIIGIDAGIGDKDHIGMICIRNHAVSPGDGFGRKLPKVGDISFIGIVDNSNNVELFFNKNIRENFIYKIAKNICDVLEHVYKEITIN